MGGTGMYLRRQVLCRIGEVTNSFGVWDPPPCSARAKFTTKQTAEDDSAIIYKGERTNPGIDPQLSQRRWTRVLVK